MLEKESASLRYYVCQFSDKMDNFVFLGPNLPKWIFRFKFQKCKSGFRISTSKIPCEPIFKIDNFEFFQPKFGEIAQLRAIFWFEYC